MKTTQHITIINVSQEVERLSRELYRQSSLEGKKAGKNNLPAHEEFKKPSYIKEVQSRCQQLLHKIYRALSKEMEEFKTSFHQLKEEYVENKIAEHIQSVIDSLKQELETKKKRITERYKNKRAEYRADIPRIKTRIEMDKIELDGTVYYPVKKRFIAEFVFTFFLFLGEVWANFQSCSYIFRETGLPSLALAIAIGLGFYGVGWASVAIFLSTMEKVTKWAWIIALNLAVLIAFYVLANVRVKIAESSESVIVISAFSIMVFSILLYVGMIVAKRYISPKKEVLRANKEYRRIKASIAEKEQSIKTLERRIEKSYKEEQRKIDTLTEEYEERIEAQKSDYIEKYEQLKEYQIKHNQLLKRGLEVHNELTEVALESTYLYVKEVNTYRSDGLVLENPMVSLANPLASYQIIHDHDIKNLFNINLN